MSVKAKQKFNTLSFAAIIILIGHWIDFFLMIMPGASGHHHHWGIGILEVGIALGFAGLFIFIAFQSLSKASLVAVNHPLLKESTSYHS